MYSEIIFFVFGVLVSLALIIYLISISRKGRIIYNIIYSISGQYLSYYGKQIEQGMKVITQGLTNISYHNDKAVVSLNDGTSEIQLCFTMCKGKWKIYAGISNTVIKLPCIYANDHTLFISTTPRELGYDNGIFVKIKEIGSDDESTFNIGIDEVINLQNLINNQKNESEDVDILADEILEYDD